ncbi:MAG TPA: cbb3-type cytochrome c oxidase subunit I [Sphingobacteriaceae bacterium]
MSDLNTSKAAAELAVLPFYAVATLAFFVLSVLLFISADYMGGHYFQPKLLAVVHLAALGWATMIIFGASYQLLPVICESPLFSSILAFASFILLTIGVYLLVVSFWFFQTGWLMICGGTFVLLSTLCYLANVLLTSQIFHQYSIQTLFMVSSALWLLFTVIVGLLLAVNLHQPFIERNHLDILKLHAHAGIAGWFLQLVTGVSIKLLPMFLLGRSQKERLLRYAFFLQNCGLLLFFADVFFTGFSSRALIWAALIAGGVICHMLYLLDVFKHRLPKPLDYQMKHSFLSFLFLAITLLVIPIVVISDSGHWSILYGTLIFMGWLTAIILGKTYKTLPFIVWNKHYKNLTGKQKVPLPKHLYNETLVKLQFFIYIAAMMVLVAGILSAVSMLVKAGFLLFIAVSLIYGYGVLSILFHKPKSS